MTPPESRDGLEASIDRMLRDLPPRRARIQLSSRVLAQIQLRRRRSGWQMGFAYWPVAARAMFCVAALAVAMLALELPLWLLDTMDSVVPVNVSRVLALFQGLARVSSSIAQSVPMPWVRAMFGVIGAAYIAFFAIGAAGYRTLYANR
jgi:hypothetical protein